MCQGVFEDPLCEAVFSLAGVVAEMIINLLFERKFHFLKLLVPPGFIISNQLSS
jgi:hypothetical protein